jgi:hypothetical protein
MPPAPIERTFSFRIPENVRCYRYDVAIDRRQPLGVALGRWGCVVLSAKNVIRSARPLDWEALEAYRNLVGGVNAPGEYRHEGD